MPARSKGRGVRGADRALLTHGRSVRPSASHRTRVSTFSSSSIKASTLACAGDLLNDGVLLSPDSVMMLVRTRSAGWRQSFSPASELSARVSTAIALDPISNS